MIGDNEVILPMRDLTFTSVSPVPRFASGGTSPWPRMLGPVPMRTALIGGLPTFIGREYSNVNRHWIFQHDYATGIWARPSYMGNNASNYMNGDSFIFYTNNDESKGIKWGVNYYFYNFANFPVDGLPDGVVYAGARISNRLTDRICFGQGGVSCTTTPGDVLLSPLGGGKEYMTTAGAGCPSTNNWGIADIYAESIDSTYTVSDGSGSGLLQPLLRAPNVEDCFKGADEYRTAYLGNRYIATVGNDARGSAVVRILYVSPYGSAPSALNPCTGELGLRVTLVYQKDMREIFGAGSYNNCPCIWSDGKGLLAIVYARNGYRRFCFMRFPGPIIQPVNISNNGGSPYEFFIPYIFRSGHVGYMRASNSSSVTQIFVSTTVLDFGFKLKYNISANPNAVYASNIVSNMRG